MCCFLFRAKNPFSCLGNSILKVRKCIQEDKGLGCGWGDQRFSSSQTYRGFAGRSQVKFLLFLHHNVACVGPKMVLYVGVKKVIAIKQKKAEQSHNWCPQWLETVGA